MASPRFSYTKDHEGWHVYWCLRQRAENGRTAAIGYVALEVSLSRTNPNGRRRAAMGLLKARRELRAAVAAADAA
jgi:hypothetical protein